jgi:glycosyltransferase involved in cell wall biosynthesis
MRVGVYVPDWGSQMGGAHVFLRDVVGALVSEPGAHQFHVIYGGREAPAWSAGLDLERLPTSASLFESTLELTATRLALDLVWFLAPESQPVSLPYFATVWDLEHRNQPFFPEVSVTGWTWEQRELHYRSVLPRAACVIVGTEEGKRQVERYYAVPQSNIEVVRFPTPSFSPEELTGDPRALVAGDVQAPYLFYPAGCWPHKNHVVLLRALKRLIERDGLDLQLVLTGADHGNLAHVLETAAEIGVAERVRWLGFVSRRTLVTLYRESVALVYPSFFGPDNLPPLEAFALGCPVLTAALPGTAELYGDAAILLNPTDEEAWAGAVLGLMRDPRRATDLRERGLARNGLSTPSGYLRAISARLDALEPVRSCWSRSKRYLHA